MNAVWYVAPWVFGSLVAGLLTGLFLRRGHAKGEEAAVQEERQATLKMLAELLGAAERIANRVDDHNSEIREHAQQVDRLHATGEMAAVKQALLGQMTALLNSNTWMQEDLRCTRYRLEEQAVEIDHARKEARTDALTEVDNRRAFDEKLHVLLDGWRQHGEPFVLILTDLDKFKWINDSHGHAVGDRVLKAVGARLKQATRDGDFVARYGGDEFAILLPGASLKVGGNLAEAIRCRIADKACRVAVRGGEISLSISIGVAAPRDGDTDESIIERADRAMYHSKRLGRDYVVCQETEVEPVPS